MKNHLHPVDKICPLSLVPVSKQCSGYVASIVGI